MAAAQAAENHGDEWGLTWHFRWAIYPSIPTWTHSQDSQAAAEALSLKISSHGASLKWTQRPWQSAQEVISYEIKRGIPLWIWWKVNGNWENNMIRIFQWRESHCRTNSSVKRNKSKWEELWESQSGIRVGELTIWVKSFEIQSSPGWSVPPE